MNTACPLLCHRPWEKALNPANDPCDGDNKHCIILPVFPGRIPSGGEVVITTGPAAGCVLSLSPFVWAQEIAKYPQEYEMMREICAQHRTAVLAEGAKP